jgi:hypothetical protein
MKCSKLYFIQTLCHFSHFLSWLHPRYLISGLSLRRTAKGRVVRRRAVKSRGEHANYSRCRLDKGHYGGFNSVRSQSPQMCQAAQGSRRRSPSAQHKISRRPCSNVAGNILSSMYLHTAANHMPSTEPSTSLAYVAGSDAFAAIVPATPDGPTVRKLEAYESTQKLESSDSDCVLVGVHEKEAIGPKLTDPNKLAACSPPMQLITSPGLNPCHLHRSLRDTMLPRCLVRGLLPTST